MKIYILDQRKDTTSHNATGKAMTDVFEIMKECGVTTLPGMPKDAHKLLKIFDLVILSFYSIFRLKKSDFCIFVYQDNAMKIKLLQKLKTIRGFKTICFVNDVNSLRTAGLYSDKCKNEIDNDFNLIGTADIIMAPNEGSKAYMQERGIQSQIVTVDVWDYLMDEQMGAKCDANVDFVLPIVRELIENGIARSVTTKWKVGFAGNLGKSGFLDGLAAVAATNVEYHLWGDAYGRQFNDNSVIYEGSVSPNVLPLELSEKVNFGVVWDGLKADCIEGGFGEYLRFNNSHKCGCYLASGIPVIVWEESGMAHFVKRTGCGFTVKGLQDIPDILSRLTSEEYDAMLSAVRIVAADIRNGQYLKNSLESATNAI